MHPSVESLPGPAPDYRRFLDAIYRRCPDRVPLIELAVHAEVVSALLDEPAAAESRAVTRQNVRLLHRLGYDAVKVSATIPFQYPTVTSADSSTLSRTDREWQDQHGGAIDTVEDCERYPWPKQDDVDFGPVEAAAEVLPDGMRLIGFSGGIVEFATNLIGLERFMYAIYDDPDLISVVIDRVGRTIYGVFEAYCQMDAVCALWLGDDLGSKNGLLVSPDLLQAHVFPWYARFVELAHSNQRPFLFHSCGKIDSIMPALIQEIGIDAKHSFEDAIEPVEHFIDRWSSKVGVLGGVDVNILTMGDQQAITARVRQILERTAQRGGYACGSGNSIPNYVPPENFLTMIRAVSDFNAGA